MTIRNLIYSICFVLLSIGVSIWPWLWSDEYLAPLNWYALRLDTNATLLLSGLVIVLGIIHAFSCAMVFGVSFRLFRSTGARLALVFPFFFSSIVLILLSWITYRYRGVFLVPKDLELFRMATDWDGIKWVGTSGDLDVVLSIILISLCVSATQIGLCKAIFKAGFRLLYCVLILAVSWIAVLLMEYRVAALPLEAEAEFNHLARYNLSPLLSIYKSLTQDHLNEPEATISTKDLLPNQGDSAEAPSSITENALRPNIVLIIIEALRADVIEKVENGTEVTPNLNRWARQGVSYSKAFATAPETAYSISAIVSGLHPLKFPYRDLNANLNYPLRRIYDLLKFAGYETHYFTATEWAVVKRLTRSSLLDSHTDVTSGSGDAGMLQSLGQDRGPLAQSLHFYDRANLKRSLELLSQPSAAPRFITNYLVSTHAPYRQLEGYHPFGKFQENESQSFIAPNVSRLRETLLHYYNNVHYLDSLLGEIFDGLQRGSQTRPTVFIVTGDHGEHFGEHGQMSHPGPLYPVGLAVPLVVFGADQHRLRIAKDAVISHIDIAPTILSIADLPPYRGYQGESLVYRTSLKKGGVVDVSHRPVFATVQMLDFEDAIITSKEFVVRSRRGGGLRAVTMSSGKILEFAPRAPLPVGIQSLAAQLDQFRANQFFYYGLPEAERNKYLPPAIATLPGADATAP